MGVKMKVPLLGASVCCRQLRRALYIRESGVPRDFMAALQKDYDVSPEGFKNWINKEKFAYERDSQKYVYERHEILGPDLACCHFMLARGASCKFVGDDHWVKVSKDDKKIPLPNKRDLRFKLEAMDASGTNLMYEGFDNFTSLKWLKHLDLSNCEFIDDWCLDRLQQNKFTLRSLNLSGCNNITERGLAALHKINLDRLVIRNMRSLSDPELTVMLLEDMMPNTRVISDVDYTQLPSSQEGETPMLAAQSMSEENSQL